MGKFRCFETLVCESCFVPDRDAMAPPELSADAPVPLLAEPVEVAPGVALGVDLDRAGGHRVHRPLGQLVHPDEPLIGEVGLDSGLATVGVADAVGVGLDLYE